MTLPDELASVARVRVRKNSASNASDLRRRCLNFIEGSNVTITVADDSQNEKADVTIAAAGGSPVGFGAVVVNTFTVGASQTWNKPTGAAFVRVICVGGGGGGSSGAKGTSSVLSGSGGSWGYLSEGLFVADVLPNSVTVTVGGGGAGGAAQSTNSGANNNGSDGNETWFGASTSDRYVAAAGGKKGTTVGGGSTARGGVFVGDTGTVGANGQVGVGVAPAGFHQYLGAGGSGGGIDSGGTAQQGGIGGIPYILFGTTAPAVGGANTGTAGGAGTSGSLSNVTHVIFGSGGAGGGGSTTAGVNGGDGGKGATGCGGGGGGSGKNSTNNSGKGGDGGDGICVVISWIA